MRVNVLELDAVVAYMCDAQIGLYGLTLANNTNFIAIEQKGAAWTA